MPATRKTAAASSSDSGGPSPRPAHQLGERLAERDLGLGHDLADLGLDDRLGGEVEVDPLDPGVRVDHAPDAGGEAAHELVGGLRLADLHEDLRDQDLGDLTGDRGDEALLGAEVVGDQPLVLARGRGDLGRGHARVAVALEDVERAVADPLPGARRGTPGPDPCRRWCGRHAGVGAAIGSMPIAASFFESDFIAYSKMSVER